MKVKDIINAFRMMRFDVLDDKSISRKLSFDDLGQGWYGSGPIIIIHQKDEDGEYQSKEYRRDEIKELMHDESIINLEVSKDCEVIMKPRVSLFNDNDISTSNCTLHIYL